MIRKLYPVMLTVETPEEHGYGTTSGGIERISVFVLGDSPGDATDRLRTRLQKILGDDQPDLQIEWAEKRRRLIRGSTDKGKEFVKGHSVGLSARDRVPDGILLEETHGLAILFQAREAGLVVDTGENQ